VQSANRAFHETFRTTPKEIEGRPLHEVGHGSWNLPGLRRQLKELGEGVALEGFRVELDLNGAGHRVFVLNARRIEHTSSTLLALEDVTEREHAVAALRRTEAGYREMLMTAAEAIFMSDRTGRIVFANDMATKYFGYAAEELAGLSVDLLVPKGLSELHAQHRTEYLAEAIPRPMGRDRDLVGRRKDGSEFPIEVILGSMQGGSGQLIVSFVTDISRRREAEQKIRDYQGKLQKMAFEAAVAEERERRRIAVDLHDRIGQSLALAQIKLSSVREAVSGAPRAAIDEAVELIAQSVTDTRTLTFELSPPVLYDLGLKEALAWLVEEVEKQHGLRIELVDDAADKPLDDATAALVFRAVRELLMNVLKHAKAGTARVSLRRTNDDVDIEVEDKGVGFDATDLAPRPGSGGFGLFSVREQINRLGGTVEVVSAPAQGTCVTMRVPVKGKANHENTPRG
jgi:PAS domain S-box-containing protein